jgi:hypothetical protein
MKRIFTFLTFVFFATFAFANNFCTYVGYINGGCSGGNCSIEVYVNSDTAPGEDVMAQAQYNGGTYTSFSTGSYIGAGTNSTHPTANWKVVLTIPQTATNVMLEVANFWGGNTANGYFYSGTIYSVATPLPIKLSTFDGKSSNTFNTLNWQSESEINAARYEVQKSRDNNAWTTFETVKATGKANNSTAYRTLDAAAFANTYYRLKMVDNDGSFSYSKVIMVKNERTEKIAIYPNPVDNELIINTLENVNTIQIFDVKGTKIMDQNIGNGVISFENMPSGLYFVSLINENGAVVFNQKIVKN